MNVNFVMANNIYSKIFEDISEYFKEYSKGRFNLFVTEKEICNADIYHYHRPNKNEKLFPKSVISVHHDLNDSDKSLDLNKFIGIYRKADFIVCLNSEQKKFLEKYNITNSTVIPHGYNDKIFEMDFDKSQNDFENKIRIGVISKKYGRKVKGEAYLYDLLLRLDNKKFSWVFVGEGRSEEAVIAEKYGFSVKCFEYLPYCMFHNLYENIDLLLILSIYEGGPANIPEALITGTPILSQPVGMAIDYIVEGVNGYFLSNDIDKDGSLFKKIGENSTVLNTLISGAEQSGKSLTTWEQVVDQYYDIYSRLVGEKNA